MTPLGGGSFLFSNYSPEASLGASRHALQCSQLSDHSSPSHSAPARRSSGALTIDLLLDARKVNRLDTADLLLRQASQSRASSSDGASGAASNSV